jgi:hypothetical protein
MFSPSALRPPLRVRGGSGLRQPFGHRATSLRPWTNAARDGLIVWRPASRVTPPPWFWV